MGLSKMGRRPSHQRSDGGGCPRGRCRRSDSTVLTCHTEYFCCPFFLCENLCMEDLPTRNSKKWRKWRLEMLSLGLCTTCGKKRSIEGKVRCVHCLAKRKKTDRQRRTLFRKEGLCHCGGPRPAVGKKCDACVTGVRNGRRSMRSEALALYGSKCACCGETIPQFLTFDHINRDGAADRRMGGKKEAFLRGLLKQPRLDIQVLCFNCNLGRELNGGICPHEVTRKAAGSADGGE